MYTCCEGCVWAYLSNYKVNLKVEPEALLPSIAHPQCIAASTNTQVWLNQSHTNVIQVLKAITGVHYHCYGNN